MLVISVFLKAIGVLLVVAGLIELGMRYAMRKEGEVYTYSTTEATPGLQFWRDAQSMSLFMACECLAIALLTLVASLIPS